MGRGKGPSAVALIAVAALVATGCGGSSGTQAASSGGGGAQAVNGVVLPPSASDLNVKPAIPKPQGPPPGGLQVRDVVQGNGKVAATGDKLTVQYVGVSWSSGQEFDSSWSRNKEPFTFKLGAGDVIPGWDQGLVGMSQGGRRELVIPPAKAYGPQGQPPSIGPNETLVFVIDLQKVK
jgi:peptidylprolyl isomerase